MNCEVVSFCPHGNGTHTEGVGHLTKRRLGIDEILAKEPTLFLALLITVTPEEIGKTSDSYSAKHEKTDLVYFCKIL